MLTLAEARRQSRHGVLDMKGAAKFLSRSRRYIQMLVNRGELVGYVSGGKRLFSRVELREWLAKEMMENSHA